MSAQAMSDLDRRLANVLRYGTVASLAGGKVTVKLDDNTTTAALPWFAARAGNDRAWWAPEPGEQVMVLSPSGELSRGCVLPAIFQDAHPENGSSPNVSRHTYQDGTVVEYDRQAHRLLVDASASNGSVQVDCGSGSVTVNCQAATVNASSGVTLNTPETHCTGNLLVDGVTTTGNLISSGEGGPAQITGGIQATGGSVTHDGKNIGSTHTHGGVQPGGGSTDEPN